MWSLVFTGGSKGFLKGGDKFLQHFRGQPVDSGCCCATTSRWKGPAEGVRILSVSQWGPDADAQGGIRIINDQRVGSFFFFLGLQVGKNTSYSSGPWSVGKVEDPIAVAWIDDVLAECQGHVLLESLTQDCKLRGGGDKVQRVLMGEQCPVQISRVKVEICQFCAVAIIIEKFPKFLQLHHVLHREGKRLAGLMGGIMEIIAEGGDNGPFTETSLEQRVDNERGTGIRARVDMGGERWRFRDHTCKMVIDVDYLIELGQKCLQKRTVALQGDVKDSQRAVFYVLHCCQEGDISFNAGDQDGIGLGRMQTELMEGTDSVGIAIEDVILHGVLLSPEIDDPKGVANICQVEQQHDALVSRGIVGAQFHRPARLMIDEGDILFYGLRVRE